MKATIAVHSERTAYSQYGNQSGVEEYQVAALDLEGDAALVAAALRALADSISPQRRESGGHLYA